MAKSYEEMTKELLAEKRGSIEGIQKQIAEREGQNQSWVDRIDLAPLASFIDSQFGGNLTQSVQGPTPNEKNQMVIGKLQQALANQKDQYANQALDYFKNKYSMDMDDKRWNRDKEYRGFDEWAKREQLAQGWEGLDIRRASAKAKANAPKKFTADQTNAATFGKRAMQAEAIFGDLENDGYNRASRSESISSFFLPTEFQGENLRKQDQAERNFVNAILRRESGAAISPAEFSSAEKQYFPRPGDSEEIIAQKRANRLQSIEGLRVGAGDAWSAVKYINPLMSGNQKSDDGMVRVSNGSETLDIPMSDLDEALSEGFRRVE